MECRPVFGSWPAHPTAQASESSLPDTSVPPTVSVTISVTRLPGTSWRHRTRSHTPNCHSGAKTTKFQPISYGIPRVALQQGRDLRGARARQPWRHRRYTPGPPTSPAQLTQLRPGVPGLFPPQSSILGNLRVPPESMRRRHPGKSGGTSGMPPKRWWHLPVPCDMAPSPRASSHKSSAFSSPHPGLTGRSRNPMSQPGVRAPRLVLLVLCCIPALGRTPLRHWSQDRAQTPHLIATISDGQQARLLGRKEGVGEVSELGESY